MTSEGFTPAPTEDLELLASPRELQRYDIDDESSLGNEYVPIAGKSSKSRIVGKVVASLAVVGLIGALALAAVHGSSPEESSRLDSGISEVALVMKVGPPDGADPAMDTSGTLASTLPKLCDAAVVQKIASELKAGAPAGSGPLELGIMLLAQTLAVKKAALIAYLGTLGFDASHVHSAVSAQDLCEKLVSSIPKGVRPPGHDVGGRLGNGMPIWDIDLSPAALSSVQIPDAPPDKGDMFDEPPTTPAPTRRLESAAGDIASDVADVLAGIFRIYPADAAQQSAKAAAPQLAAKAPAPVVPVPAAPVAPAGNPCAPATAAPTTPAPAANPCAPARRLKSNAKDEVIYGNGAAYVGYQTYTRTFKACVAWSSMGYNFPANYCRNNDGSAGIWCFTSTAGAWGLCDPIGAPKMFAETLEEARIVAKAWLSKTLREFSGAELPKAYEKWMGPSQVVSKTGLTTKGCACMNTWSYQGKTVTNYCGNPDGDAGGNWCHVTSAAKSCQGTTWGYCFKNAGSDKPCGNACQHVHKKLVGTRALMDKLTFSYDKDKKGTFAYVWTYGNRNKAVLPVQRIQDIQKNFRQGASVTLKGIRGSAEVKGRKRIIMCPVWYNQCNGNFKTCSRTNQGTTVGTIIHETMHHYPVGLKDYLYYRQRTSNWVMANKYDNTATKVVKNAADPMEYFVADNNGYVNTGR